MYTGNKYSTQNVSIQSWRALPIVTKLALTTLIIAAILLLAGIMVPVYIDEFMYHITLERFFLEGGKTINLYPQCPDTFLMDTPITLIPGAAIIAIFFSHLDMLGMRLMGMCIAFAWFGIVWRWVSSLEPRKEKCLLLYAGLVAIQMMGILPFTFVLTRPEQILVLCIAFYVLMPQFLPQNYNTNSWQKKLGLIAAYIIVTSIFYFTHPTSLYFLPVVCTSLFLSFRKSYILAFSLMALTGFTAWQTFDYLQTGELLKHCTEAPGLMNMFSKMSLSLPLLVTDPIAFLSRGFYNLFNGIPSITHHMHISEEYQSSWLPPALHPFPGFVISILNFLIDVFWACVGGGLIIALLYRFSRIILRKNTGFPKPVTDYLAFALGLSLVGHMFHYNRFHFTSIELIIPCIVMLGLLTFPAKLPEFISSAFGRKILVTIFLIAIINFCILVINVGPGLVHNTVHYQVTIANQNNSYQTILAWKKYNKIKELAHKCGILESDVHDLILDDTSYPVFRSYPRPMHAVYVNPNFMGFDLKGKMREFLLKHDSSGYIGKCDYMAPELNDLGVMRQDNMCCLTRKSLQQSKVSKIKPQ
jgi:hypothetical protein